MLINYFKVFLRNVRRNAFFTFLNVLGLSLGIGVSLLIALYVSDEMSFDTFHKDGNRIYRSGIHGVLSGNSFEMVASCAPLSAALSREVPGVESSIRIGQWSNLLIQKGSEQIMEQDVILADSNFFDFFSFRLLIGDPTSVLKAPKSIVLTESASRKYFDDKTADEIIGQTLLIGNSKESYQVTGICADPPRNSHIQYNLLLSINTWEYANENQWTSNNLYTYFKIGQSIEIAQINSAYENLVVKYVGPEIQQYIGISLDEWREGGGDYGYFSQPLSEIHFSEYEGELGPAGNRQNITIFSIVALFVLIIAIVNYINLATAKASDRSKEIGIRKSVGAVKQQLIGQFLFESVALTLLSTMIALGGILLVLDGFNHLTDKSFGIFDILGPYKLVLYTAGALGIGLVSGFYPSLVLSSYKPAEIIKGTHRSVGKGLNPRNLLVGFQFALTAMSIILTIVVSRQLEHMRTYDLGFDKEQLMVIFNARSLPNQESFKNELSQLTGISGVSITQAYPPMIFNNSVYRVADTNEDHLFHMYYTDPDHLQSLGLRLKEGRFFENYPLDKNSVVLNETALRLSGWSSIADKRILEIDEEEHIPYNVIGVVEDFHFQGFKSEVKPLLIFCYNEGGFVTMRLEGSNSLKVVPQIEAKWAKFSDGKPFDYAFVDQQFNDLFKTEERLSDLTVVFSLLTIITASLGLFGLAAFVARSRRKEFGIRKVLGARELTIWLIQLRYFMTIALIAFVISLPLSFYLVNIWLDEFVYRISNGVVIYGIAMCLVVGVILISVGYQSLKASRLSPVNVLRNI